MRQTHSEDVIGAHIRIVLCNLSRKYKNSACNLIIWREGATKAQSERLWTLTATKESSFVQSGEYQTAVSLTVLSCGRLQFHV